MSNRGKAKHCDDVEQQFRRLSVRSASTNSANNRRRSTGNLKRVKKWEPSSPGSIFGEDGDPLSPHIMAARCVKAQQVAALKRLAEKKAASGDRRTPHDQRRLHCSTGDIVEQFQLELRDYKETLPITPGNHHQEELTDFLDDARGTRQAKRRNSRRKEKLKRIEQMEQLMGEESPPVQPRRDASEMWSSSSWASLSSVHNSSSILEFTIDEEEEEAPPAADISFHSKGRLPALTPPPKDRLRPAIQKNHSVLDMVDMFIWSHDSKKEEELHEESQPILNFVDKGVSHDDERGSDRDGETPIPTSRRRRSSRRKERKLKTTEKLPSPMDQGPASSSFQQSMADMGEMFIWSYNSMDESDLLDDLPIDEATISSKEDFALPFELPFTKDGNSVERRDYLKQDEQMSDPKQGLPQCHESILDMRDMFVFSSYNSKNEKQEKESAFFDINEEEDVPVSCREPSRPERRRSKKSREKRRKEKRRGSGRRKSRSFEEETCTVARDPV